MNYDVVPLNGGKQFELFGVKFKDKSFMFWKKKGNQPIKEVIVVFDKKNENMEVREGTMILSLKALNNYRDLRDAILIFLDIIQNKQIKFHFIINNEKERQIAEGLGKELRFSFDIKDVNDDKKQKVGQNLAKMEEEIKNQELMVGNSQMIEKNDNGVLKQITVDKNRGVAYENNGILTTEEEEIILLREWMNDPIKASELSKMSIEARNELLTKTVMANRKEYRLEEVNEVEANDKVGEVAMSKAEHEDGLVNTELGITQNGIYNENKYSVAEEQGDKVQVVNPTVVNSTISSNGVKNTNSSVSYESDIKYEEVQERNMDSDKLLYLDEEYNIYDANVSYERPIGKVGFNGYELDLDKNCVVRHGNFEGYVSDYKEIGKSNSNVYVKPKVRTLEKQDKNAAFVSFPVIIFVLSFLLLVGSAILLFVVD